MPEPEEWVTIGKITSAHGIRGEVKVALFIDDADFLLEVESLFVEGRPRREWKVNKVRFHKKQAIVTFEEIADRNEAERLRGREVVVPFEWLPALEDDEFYVAQIVGLSVETTTGEALGTVDQVLFTGANEVYVVRGGPRGEVLIPAIDSVVQKIDLEAEQVLVSLPEGLID